MTEIYNNGKRVVYQSEGSSRYNVAVLKKDGKRGKFLRGFRTVEEARFYADNTLDGTKNRKLV